MIRNSWRARFTIGTLLVLMGLAGCRAGGGQQPASSPRTSQQQAVAPQYVMVTSLGDGREWRPYPLIVDINGDGHLDIVATHRRPLHLNALHIWLGTGKGTFNSMDQTWHSPGYSGLAAGDINRDGHADLVAASHYNRLHTFFGNGNGRFTETVMQSPEGYTTARLVDINGDGHLDVVTLGWLKAGIEIYRGDGTGHWAFVTRLMQGNIGRDLAMADVNADGKVDIVASTASRGVMIYLQNSIGDWSGKTTDFVSATHEFRSVALGDVNRDGYLDIALNGGFQGPSNPNGPDVYLADGNGGWTPASNGLKVLQPPTTWGIALGDVDRDGNLDLVAGGNLSGTVRGAAYGLFLFTGDGRGNWRLRPDSGLPTTGVVIPYGIALEDLNHDGLLDIVVTHGGTEKTEGYVTVWLNQQGVS